MTVKARFRCHNIEDYKFSADGTVTQRQVKLSPVYDSDPTSPNYSFSQATPSGEISMSITNKDAFDQFEVNKTYDITFEEYQAPETAT